MRFLRLPDRGRRPVGGGPQQQLPLAVLQLLGNFTLMPKYSTINAAHTHRLATVASPFVYLFYLPALQRKHGGEKLLC